VVSGGTGTGKTTVLNALSSFIPDDERIVTIEDAAELQLQQRHVVRLESRPANIEGKGAVPIRQLVINSLRMRPDRIVVGECRGGEALDMLQAMNTGHDGSLTTVHANTARDTLSRVETLVLMAGMELPLRAIREQVAAAFDVIVQLGRLQDGSRKIIQVAEVQGMEGDVIVMQDLFHFVQTGVEEEKVQGYFSPTGVRPKFIEKLERAGLFISPGTFMPTAGNAGRKPARNTRPILQSIAATPLSSHRSRFWPVKDLRRSSCSSTAHHRRPLRLPSLPAPRRGRGRRQPILHRRCRPHLLFTRLPRIPSLLAPRLPLPPQARPNRPAKNLPAT
jgi:energy-coupling factor transporter ATP-binding protein EcfA2